MKKSRFSEEQIVRDPKRGEFGQDGSRVVQGARGERDELITSESASTVGWNPTTSAGSKKLEAENAALKRIVANQALELEATGKLLREMGFGLRAPVGAEFLKSVGMSARGALPHDASAANRLSTTRIYNQSRYG